MRWGDHYKDLLDVSNENEAFDYLINTLKSTNRSADYFVNWDKIFEKVSEVEKEIHLLDVLIGKDDIKKEAIEVFTEYPKTIIAARTLLAIREREVSLLKQYDRRSYIIENVKFDKTTPPHEVADFLEQSGLFTIMKEAKIKCLMDYITGVEVGLDSNGRKNRGGESMEAIVKVLLNETGFAKGWEIIAEADSKKIEDQWGLRISTGHANKRLDFAVKTQHQLFLIETNFYSSNGSKLKSTAEEYSNVWNSYGFPFIWITDGFGWRNNATLRDAFEKIDHILNIDMVQKGILEAIVNEHNSEAALRTNTTPVN